MWSHVHPMMALKDDKSSTTENCTFWVTGPAWTGNTTSPREVVEAPLNPNSIRPRFFMVDGGSLICLYVDIYKRSVELLGSIKICFTSKSLIPSVRIRVSSCGYSTQLGSIGGNVIISSIRRVPHLASHVGRSLPSPSRRLLVAIFVFFVWNCISHWRDPHGCSWL